MIACAAIAVAVVGCTPQPLPVFDREQTAADRLDVGDLDVGIEPDSVRALGEEEGISYFTGKTSDEKICLITMSKEFDGPSASCSDSLGIAVREGSGPLVELVAEGARRTGGHWIGDHLWVSD